MKKFKKIMAGLTAVTALTVSMTSLGANAIETSAQYRTSAIGSTSATNNEIQPRTWYMYGDVDNNGRIDLLDLVAINKAIKTFNDLTGSSELPLEYAVARPVVYFENENYIPQAADIDGDGYITDNDSHLLLYYVAERYDEAGRCGQPFFIN